MSHASHLLLAIEKCRDGFRLTESLCLKVEATEAMTHQWASLGVWLIHRDVSNSESQLLQKIKELQGDALERLWQLESPNPDYQNDWVDDLLLCTQEKKELGEATIERWINEFVDEKVTTVEMSLWLALVCRYGLHDGDLIQLTKCMTDSGVTYDYRDAPDLKGRRLLRRYPTGALSEKSALILPALLCVFAEDYPLASPFMVARSLSFTGGTWDKLLSIPGFTFPHPGEEAIQTMRDSACAMVVSKDDCNPADRLLYQLRSATGTVRSIPLAAASIASKQLAMPAHRLLLDVRYGEGAFFNKAEARELSTTIRKIIEQDKIACDILMTDTEQPGGSSIGNAVEVMEAIAIMSNHTESWDTRGIEDQKKLVCQFFATLMSQEFKELDFENWVAAAYKSIEEGRVEKAFEKILKAHQVTESTVETILKTPESLCPSWEKRYTISSEISGTLKSIDQRSLGYLVNVEMGGGGNDYQGEVVRGCGVILHKRLGDHIEVGETLLEVIPSEKEVALDFEQRCQKCFTIVEKDDL